MKNVALLDTYLRKRAQDNVAKGPPAQVDVVTHQPTQGIEMRFTDVQIDAQPIQPAPHARAIPMPPQKFKKPKKGKSGEQEMGVV
jgi:hypothetical protein